MVGPQESGKRYLSLVATFSRYAAQKGCARVEDSRGREVAAASGPRLVAQPRSAVPREGDGDHRLVPAARPRGRWCSRSTRRRACKPWSGASRTARRHPGGRAAGVRVHATRDPVAALCLRSAPRPGDGRVSGTRARRSISCGFMEAVAAAVPTGPRPCHLGLPEHPLRRDRAALDRLQCPSWRALRVPLHAETRLVGEPDRAVLQHPAAAVPAPGSFRSTAELRTRRPGVHRRLEPRPGPSLPVDLHRLSVASWRRAASGGRPRERESPWRRTSEPGRGPAHPGRRRHPASSDPRARRLRTRRRSGRRGGT